ncbi:hypothetical protein SISSUDRAFT_1054151 [Sistotremastrum suecicum HHB10207 ss-3]|uniref:Uncharacterized protein n=1 Tax=Sistotremastrum suecicum HHB10207 ss-3 TaxID=1314776 RepID=A0A165YR35_9AGAM|nr:hypothetical protein SISSUDRAFT_1054151 [Sistotremastrum suecicum HHB10207 ss-3]
MSPPTSQADPNAIVSGFNYGANNVGNSNNTHIANGCDNINNSVRVNVDLHTTNIVHHSTMIIGQASIVIEDKYYSCVPALFSNPDCRSPSSLYFLVSKLVETARNARLSIFPTSESSSQHGPDVAESKPASERLLPMDAESHLADNNRVVSNSVPKLLGRYKSLIREQIILVDYDSINNELKAWSSSMSATSQISIAALSEVEGNLNRLLDDKPENMLDLSRSRVVVREMMASSQEIHQFLSKSGSDVLTLITDLEQKVKLIPNLDSSMEPVSVDEVPAFLDVLLQDITRSVQQV